MPIYSYRLLMAVLSFKNNEFNLRSIAAQAEMHQKSASYKLFYTPKGSNQASKHLKERFSTRQTATSQNSLLGSRTIKRLKVFLSNDPNQPYLQSYPENLDIY